MAQQHKSETSKKSSSNRMMSTTALAKHFDIPAKTLFTFLTDKAWIERVDQHWRLTGKGEFEGGEYIQSKKYGEYIGWPPEISEHKIFQELLDLPVSVSALGARYDIGPHRFNALLAELGWQRRFHKGWTITPAGKKHGGIEKEDADSGVPYTVWSRSLLDNPQLQDVLRQMGSGDDTDKATAKKAGSKSAQTSLDFSAEQPSMTTRDGRQLEHQEHRRVCNWLYLMNVVHACQRPLAEPKLGNCDFYLPAAHLHLECWLEKEQASSMKQKLARIEYYKKEKLPYIDLKSEQINELDSVLPRMLLKYGITVY